MTEENHKIVRINDGNVRVVVYPYKDTYVYHMFMATEDIEDLKKHMSKQKYDELQREIFSKII